MNRKRRPFTKGDPCIYIDEYGKAVFGYYWGDLRLLGDEKPSGFEYVLVSDRTFLTLGSLQELYDKTAVDLANQRKVHYLSDEDALYFDDKKTKEHITKKLAWLTSKSSHYEKWITNQHYFAKQSIRFYETGYFEKMRYGLRRYRIVYFVLFALAKLRSLTKIVGYPTLFIKEGLATSFDTFSAYRRNLEELNDYLYKKNKYRYTRFQMTEEQYAKIEEPLRTEVDGSKKEFLESSKFITTLVISAVTIALTLFLTVGQIRQRDSQIWALSSALIEKEREAQKLGQRIEDGDKVIATLENRVAELQLRNEVVSIENLRKLLEHLGK